MSDFLDNLLSRSAGAGETVRPRPMSLYEPPGTAWQTPALAADSTTDLAQEETLPAPIGREKPRPASLRRAPAGEPAPLSEPPARPRAESPGPLLVTRAPQPSRSVLPPPSAPPVAGPPLTEDPPPLTMIRTVQQHVLVQPALPPAKPPLVSNDATRQAEGPQDPPLVAPARTQVRPPTLPRTVASRTAEPPKAAPPAPAAPPKTEGGEERPLPVQPRTAVGERLLPVKRAGQAPEAARLPAVGTPPAPPQPVIQVTIGRIEVRATPASATPARKATPAAPMTSLEEYMRQRKGGSR